MSIIDRTPSIFSLLLGVLLLIAPLNSNAQEAVPSPAAPVAQEVPAAQTTANSDAEDQQGLLEKAKAAAVTAVEKTKTAAAAAAEKAKVAAETAAETTKAAAQVAIEKTKAAAEAAVEKTSEALNAAKEAGTKAIEATKKAVTKGVVAPSEDPQQETQVSAAKQSNPQVIFKTSHGDFVVELDPEKAPITVKNFLGYVDSGYYSGTIFHRVISSFMIQGGGFSPDMNKKATEAPIILESMKGLSNLRGTIAMARTNNPNSATSQFFINVVNNRNLDSYGGGYAVFGKVISGMETVDKIRAVRTGSRAGHRDVPVENVVINSATRL